MLSSEHHYLNVNIGSGNGLVPSGNKLLPAPILTHFQVAFMLYLLTLYTLLKFANHFSSEMFYSDIIAVYSTSTLHTIAIVVISKAHDRLIWVFTYSPQGCPMAVRQSQYCHNGADVTLKIIGKISIQQH